MKQNETELNVTESSTRRKWRKKATVREIARIVGCAHCTVSRALADESCVANEMRARILKTARELGYTRRNGKALAILVPSFQEGVCYYNTRMICALSRVLDREGFSFELIPENHIRSMNEKHMDGAFSLCYSGGIARKWSELNAIPLVCINDFAYHTDRIYSVCSDDRHAMREISRYLVERGHEKVGYCDNLAAKNLNHTRRRKCFLEFAEEYSLTAFSAQTKKEIAGLLEKGISALICPFEMTDLELYAFLNQTRRIPEELELLCWHVPGITENLHMNGLSVEQDFDRLAEESVILLKQLMEGRHNLRDVSVPYRIARRSPAGNG